MARTKQYPGSVEPRGNGYRVTLYVNGQRHRFTLANVSEVEAQNYAKAQHDKLERRAARLAAGIAAVDHFSELLEDYETKRLPDLGRGTRISYTNTFAVLRAFFVDELGDPALDSIRRAHVQQFATWRPKYQRRKGKRPGPKTVARDLRVLRLLFNYAVELEFMDANPAARFKAPPADDREPVILSPDQFDRLLEAAGDRPMLRLWFLVLGETGARAFSEALRLRWDDVDLAGGFIKVVSGRDGHRTKSGRSRWCPMTPRLAAAMREHFATYRFATYKGRATPWVFHHTTTRYLPARNGKRRGFRAGDRIRSFKRTAQAAIKRAKLPAGFRPHDLRHTRVTTWLAKGANVVHVKEAVGHSDIRTTMGYSHLAREHLRSLVEDRPEREALKELAT